MTEREPLPEEEFIDLRHIFETLGKRKAFIFWGTLLAVCVTAVFSFFLIPPTYEAKALLLVSPQTQLTATQEGGIAGAELLTRIFTFNANTHLGQLKSEELLKRAAGKLGLDPHAYPLDSLAKMVKATAQKDSSLIELKVESRDPALAAKLANALASEYPAFLSEKNKEQMTGATELLAQQQKSAEEELTKAAQALKEFQAQPRSVAALEEEVKAKASDLANLESQEKKLLLEIQELRAGATQLESELAQTPRTLKVRRVDLITGNPFEGEDINPVYTSISTKLAEKRAGLAEKEAQLASIASVRGELERELAGLQAELTEKKIQQEKLQGEVDRLKETLDTLAKKATETQIARSLDLGRTQVVVVSEAQEPKTPVKPRKSLNLALAFVLGLLASTGLAFLLDYLDYTIKTPEDVARHLGLATLGTIPLATKEARRAGY